MEKKVLIAIPAYNEADNIEHVLSSLTDYGDNILVIDDGSVDNTPVTIKKMGVNVVSHKKNLGLSAAYRTMFNYADKHNYTHMVTFDADGQHETSHLPEFIESLNSFDFVAGNRFHSVDGIPDCKLASNFFAVLLTKKIFGTTVPDVACGFRAMKLDDATKYIHSLHYGVIYEMLFKQLHRNENVGTVDIPVKYDLSARLATSTNEIFGLIGEIIRYSSLPELKQISYDLFMGNDFGIDLFGYSFKGECIDHSNYRFATDIEKAKQFYKDNFF